MAPFPAPWHLTGSGLVVLFRVSRAEGLARELVPPHLRTRFRGGFSALMAVDYVQSEAGPYRELLFIPGHFDFGGRSLYSITRIFVSTSQSVAGGRANWGIPKELADFEASRSGHSLTFEARVAGKSALRLAARAGRLSFPIHSALYPFPLAHELDGRTFYTRLTASGWARRARLETLVGDGTLFPRLEGLAPFAAVSVDPFRMTFHPARVEPRSAA